MSEKKKTQFPNNSSLQSKSTQDSSFRAVKSLLEAEKNIQTIKNRIKVLQLNEQKNLNKITMQRQQIEKINMVKNEHLQQLRKLKINKHQRERIVQQIKARNQQFRKENKNKIEAVREELLEERAKEYSTVLEMRDVNESRILKNKIHTLQKKQQNRDSIVLNECKSKENINKFYDDKAKCIYQKTQAQIQRLNKNREKKQKKLIEFSRTQMQMIERHSQSQVACNEMKCKLDTMLGKIRSQKRKEFKEMKSSIYREGKQNNYALEGL